MPDDIFPTVQKISDAADVVGWFGERMSNLPEHRDEAMQLSLMCSMLQLAMSDLALRLLRGEEPYEALRATAAGEMEVDASKADLLRAVWPPSSRE